MFHFLDDIPTLHGMLLGLRDTQSIASVPYPITWYTLPKISNRYS